MKLIVALLALACSPLISGNGSPEPAGSASVPSAGPAVNCQQSALLNALLLQALLQSSQITTTTQNPLVANLNKLLRLGQNEVTPSNVQQAVRVFTTQEVSTVTQLLSTVLSVMFKNRRIPTTIFSSRVIEVTELKTITSTLGVEPTALKQKRQATDEDFSQLIDSSIGRGDVDAPAHSTAPLAADNILPWDIPDSALYAALMEPQVQEAWNNFVQIYQKFVQKKSQL